MRAPAALAPWLALAALLGAAPARAGEPSASPDPVADAGADPVADAGADAVADAGAGDQAPIPDPHYWGASRFFVAGEVDVGFLYLRPRLSGGYGQPFRQWVGMDANPLISIDGPGVYSGLRFKVPFGDLRVGGRFRTTFERSFLRPQVRYEIEDIESGEGPVSRYLSWESQLTTAVPAGPGAILIELTGTAVTLVDDGYFVFEETVRAVVEPPWVWRGRLGYGLRFMDDRFAVAPVAEFLHIPKRRTYMIRGGVLVSFRISETVQLRATSVPTLVSRDKLGTEGADTFLAGLRWRWATGGP
jgi:hypothetical protein